MNEKDISGLNPQQREAVTLGKESALVLAGAGSGKTKVLTSRIAWLIENGHATEDSILAVTFTNKAAREMRKRISTMLGRDPKKLWIGTFHGLCYRMMREHRKELGLPDIIQVLDEQDQKAQVRRIMERLGMPKDEIRSQLGDTVDFINRCKEEAQRAAQVPVVGGNENQIEIYAEYETTCEREGMFDFAELMMRVNEYLAHDKGGLRTFFNGKFTDILVDEFQDTNEMQYNWLNFLHGGKANVMAVGDDDQSIYAFRGANPKGMQEFMDSVAGGKIVRLEQNYRSTKTILDAANAVIKNNPDRLGKNLHTSAEVGGKVMFTRYEFDMPSKVNKGGNANPTEVEGIATHIKSLLSKGVDPGEIAVLYRSNHQSGGVERYLARANIPYVIYGGTRFFERAEIKNAMAYLRLAVNNNDDIAFLRVVNFPPRNLGDKAVEKIMERARLEQLSLTDACIREADAGNEKAGVFADIVLKISEAAKQFDLDDTIDFILETSGLLKHYQKLADEQVSKADKAEDEERVDRLNEIMNIASSFLSDPANIEGKSCTDLVNDFLVEAALESDQGNDKKKHGGVVTLMTVHAAKGLEFDHVVVTGLNEGVFPHERAVGEDGGIEEERRLMYVAITRARKGLFLSASANGYMYGKKMEYGTSRFVSEIPDPLIAVKDHTARKRKSEADDGLVSRITPATPPRPITPVQDMESPTESQPAPRRRVF